MVTHATQSHHDPDRLIAPSARQSFTVLAVGGSEARDRTAEILNFLIMLGYGVRLVGVVDLENSAEAPPDSTVLESQLRILKGMLEEVPVDLLIITTEDQTILRELRAGVSPSTHVLEWFGAQLMKQVRSLLEVSFTGAPKTRYVELMKEVLMSGPEVSTMVVNEDFEILDINNLLLRNTGLEREDCMGRSCFSVLRHRLKPCHRDGDSCVVRQVLETGRSAHTVREERMEGDSSRYFTVSAYPLQEEENGKNTVMMVWKDVTQGITPVLARQAQNMQENFNYLLRQDRMAALGKLAAAAVHEINNPMQGIMTFAKLIKGSLDKETYSETELEQFRKYLDLIATESARCGQILRNLLSFARKGDLKQTSVDISGLLDETFLLVRHRTELQGVELRREIHEKLPPVPGDRNQIKQAFLNVILNALESMQEGGKIAVSAKLDDEAKHVLVEVTDTGSGIPKSALPNIFEPFFTTKREGKGVGLGLSVVYGVVAQHGGDIEVTSDEGKGTTFIISLPLTSGKSGKNRTE
jgi:PAS domain S-box-containing protein